MRRAARPERLCRRCPFCAPSGRCLDRDIKSGRCGDWIWLVRYGKTHLTTQALPPQKLMRTTWEPRRGYSWVAPDHRRLRARRSRRPRGGTNERRRHEEWGVPTIPRCFQWDSSNPAPLRPADPTVASPEPPRVPSSPGLRGYYGEAPVRLPWGFGPISVPTGRVGICYDLLNLLSL